MKTRSVVTTTAALAGATALGIVAGSVTFALWQTDATLKSDVATGRFALGVQDADGGGETSTWKGAGYDSVSFRLNEGEAGNGRSQANPMLRADSAEGTAYAFKVDSSAWGRYQIDYTFKSLKATHLGQGEADESLARALRVTISKVNGPAACTPSHEPSGSVEELVYRGSLGELQSVATQRGVKGEPSPEKTDLDYYCLQLSLPNPGNPYSNTVTVDGISDANTTVTDSDKWESSGNVQYPAAAKEFALDLVLQPTLKRATP